jgi:calcineurin-like phosphoesterase family protein
MIYFTADLHFGHANVIQHCNRPFDSVEEMDAVLTRNWNATVHSSDEVYILGDFTMRPANIAHEYLIGLNGRKYMIHGNHDKFLYKYAQYEKDFEWIKDYFMLKHNGRKFVLFHYPIAEWAEYYRGAIHLYGHIHNTRVRALPLMNAGLSYNVGVDCNEFKPVSMDEIILKMEAKQRKMSFEISANMQNSVSYTAMQEIEDMRSDKLPKNRQCVKDFVSEMDAEY